MFIFFSTRYDIFQQQQIEAFDCYQHQSDPSVRGKSYLVIAPQGHCVFPIDVPSFPDSYITLPFDIGIDLFANNSNMNDKKAQEIAKFKEIFSPINFYVMAPREQNGDEIGNYWTSLNDWPPFKATTYYLQPQARLDVNPPSDLKLSSSYYYDPYFPVLTWGGNNLFDFCGPRDEQYVNDRSDVLTFQSDPLPSPLAITGRISATLFVSSDCDDTDFTVKLMDIYPEGGISTLIQDGILRMKFRDNFSKPTPLIPNQIYKVQVDLWSTSWIFPSNHRVAVAISSSNWPRFQAHINKFLPITLWNTTDPITAHNTLYYGKKYPSSITLPVVSIHDIPPNPNLLNYVVKQY